MSSPARRTLVALLGGIAVLALAWGVASARGRHLRRHHPPRHLAPLPPPPVALGPQRWPGPGAALSPVRAVFPPSFGKIKIVLDPGHGAPNNHGNLSSFCVEEQEAMMVVAEEVQTRLEATGHIDARLSRERGDDTDYPSRAEDAAAWGADVFVSLHSDVRGTKAYWFPEAPNCPRDGDGKGCGPGGADARRCPLALDAPGFSVLYSDEGDAQLVARRLAFGRAIAHRMGEAGFAPFQGVDYRPHYAADSEPGVFVDRHPEGQRIFMLRRLTMPTILIETHNALDSREALRWEEPATIEAFAGALAAALIDALVTGR